MDARDLSQKIFNLWQQKYPKDSGSIHKSLTNVPVVVWTAEEGYKEVVGVSINHLGLIEVVLSGE